MKEYKYTIDGKEYKVEIGEIVENIADVTVNGESFKVELEPEKEREEESSPRQAYRRTRERRADNKRSQRQYR